MTDKLDIKSTVTTVKTTTRTVDIPADQVETIVRKWAIANLGFTNPDVSAYCTYADGDFAGVVINEVTTEDLEDDDDGVEETKPTIRQGIPPLGRVAMYEGNEPHKSKKIR